VSKYLNAKVSRLGVCKLSDLHHCDDDDADEVNISRITVTRNFKRNLYYK